MLLLVLTLLSWLVGDSAGQCPSMCSCFRGETIVTCSGSGLTEIPQFSIRATTVYEIIAELEVELNLPAPHRDLETNFITTIRATDLDGLPLLESL